MGGEEGWTADRELWIQTGIEFAKRAIEMASGDTLGYMQLGNLVQLQGDHERAIELREQAVAIAPNDFQANWGLGSVLYRAGEPDRAIEVLQHAMRLSPRHPASLVWNLAFAELVAGRYEEAIETAERARRLAPDSAMPNLQLAAAYSALDRTEEAAGAADMVLAIDPDFTVAAWKRGEADFKDQATVDRLASLLIRAGLPK